MRRYKLAKIYFCLAVLLFVAKPFIGFAILCHGNLPPANNILVKAFTKRKIENSENDSSNIIADQKKLRDRPNLFSPRFCFFLGLLFASVFYTTNGNINSYLRRLLFGLPVQQLAYLQNRALLI
ncbi:hypothetical protein KXD93_11685 [Mucilaginibacter sp. BJC16-A38]|uniref:hypothetical protein n=1 Tax=Mucilaginibacter phenanthrenivorans TaxID=1234842 RepID=UPI00215886B1|nr:hypothetical protein [Mucilaginibacter phenanthrenivorans]MCR8558312.1 hypothetical protein [Mucilaginibacter phenanthrenivorans]